MLLKNLRVLPRAIACGLSDEDLAERGSAWHALKSRLEIVEGARFDGGFRIVARGRDADLDEVSRLVAAERECCGWATWELERTPDGATLTVSAPEELIAPLADAFLSRAS